MQRCLTVWDTHSYTHWNANRCCFLTTVLDSVLIPFDRGCWNSCVYQRRRDARLFWRVRLINLNIFSPQRSRLNQTSSGFLCREPEWKLLASCSGGSTCWTVPRFTWESGLAAEEGKSYQRATATVLRNICSVPRPSRRKPKMQWQAAVAKNNKLNKESNRWHVYPHLWFISIKAPCRMSSTFTSSCYSECVPKWISLPSKRGFFSEEISLKELTVALLLAHC